MNSLPFALFLIFLTVSCAAFSDGTSEGLQARALPPGAQARSLWDEPLVPPPLAAEDRAEKEAQLAEAKAAWDRNPDDAQSLIWYGRRLGYLGRFQDALAVFSEGVARHPEDPWMVRFRGHRYITLRRFDLAAKDLERAAHLTQDRADEIEPAGAPNARGVLIDTLKQNIYYHLALARYLQGDFARALPAWRQCLQYSTNPDSQCSATHWLYMTLRRLGREREAREVLEPIRADFDIVEYHAYFRLLLVYKGLLGADMVLEDTAPGGVDFATVGYGIGNWHLYNGREERAAEVFRQVLQAKSWHAFGWIAAESDLKRMEK